MKTFKRFNFNPYWRPISRRIKSIFWKCPKLSTFYYRLKYSQHKSLVILPHEGLGDFAAVYAGIKYLCKKHKIVYVVTRKDYFDGLRTLTNFPANLKLIRFFYKNKHYRLTQREKSLLKNKGHLIKLGHYGSDPIYMYPNCFYLKMGIPQVIAEEKYITKIEGQSNLIKLLPEGEYIYVNNQTSTDNYSHDKINYIQKVIFLSPTKLQFNLKDREEILSIPRSSSLTINFFLAKNATKLYLSDAGFFNLIIRARLHPDIEVFTRKNQTAHNQEIYTIPFDGKAHFIKNNN